MEQLMEHGLNHDNNHQLLSDSWSCSDDLLNSIFSLDSNLLDLDSNSHENFLNSENGILQPDSVSSPSMDQSDLDFIDQQLSPLLNSSDDDMFNPTAVDPMQLLSPVDSVLSNLSASTSPGLGSPSDCYEEQLDITNCINTSPPAQTAPTPPPASPNHAPKRKLSPVTSTNVVLPKIQKYYISKEELSSGKVVHVTTDQPEPKRHRIILNNTKSPNFHIVNGQPQSVQNAHISSTQKKVIKVAPVVGNPRSILLPVTLKDMKGLQSIKIINAADLKNVSNIKIAAANFLKNSKQAYENSKLAKRANITIPPTYIKEETHYIADDSTSDHGSGHSDDDDDDLMGSEESRGRQANGQFPRLELTNEEKRLLVKEGITLPSSYPLTRLEERELKRIRRKIRNKISAQDSRRRKKEYVDGLEDRVKQCTDENQTLIKRIKLLQSQNHSLASQLRKLQASVASKNGTKSTQPATCLMVLLLSIALVVAPSLRPGTPGFSTSDSQQTNLLSTIRRALLSAQQMSHTNSGIFTNEEVVDDDYSYIADEIVSFGESLADHDYQPMVNSVPKGRYTSSGYIDTPLDDDDTWPSMLSKSSPLHVKLEKYDFDNSMLLDDIHDSNDETIHLYDASMEKLEVLSPPGKLDNFLQYARHRADEPTEHIISKKNLTQPRSIVLTNGAPLRL